MASSSTGEANGGNLAPRKQSSTRGGAPNMKYMHKGYVLTLIFLSIALACVAFEIPTFFFFFFFLS
jgi:hypothetical protein